MHQRLPLFSGLVYTEFHLQTKDTWYASLGRNGRATNEEVSSTSHGENERPEVEGEKSREKKKMFSFPLQLFSLISTSEQSWWTQQDTGKIVTKVIPCFLSAFLFRRGLAEKLWSQFHIVPSITTRKHLKRKRKLRHSGWEIRIARKIFSSPVLGLSWRKPKSPTEKKNH